jgi:hypothetical protein
MMIKESEARGRESLPLASGPGGRVGSAVRPSLSGGGAPPPVPAGSAAAITFGSDFTDSDGRAPERSEGDNLRVAIHEGSHCVSGLVLFGADSLGGATIVPSASFGGLCWGPRNSAALGSTEDFPDDLCDQMRALMPADGEPILNGSEIHAHVRGRVVDLLSGSEGERLLCPDGPPWSADSDLAQARSLASIVCSSTETLELYLNFCRAEAAALVAKHRESIQAVAAALIEHRTLSGDEIVAVVAESVTQQAMAVEHARRADWRERQASAASFR